MCRAQQVTLQVYDNTALSGSPIQEIQVQPNETVHVPGMVSVRLMASMNVSTLVPNAIVVSCSSPSPTNSNIIGEKITAMPYMLWLDDHLVCQFGFYNDTNRRYQMDGSSETPISTSSRRTDWTLYGEFWPFNDTFCLMDVLLEMAVARKQSTINPLSLLRPTLSSIELQRLELTKELQAGWGLYNHHSLQEAILLPEGIRLLWIFCKDDERMESCQQEPKIPATVLPRNLTSRNLMTFDVVFMETVTLRIRYHFDGQDMQVVFETLASNNCNLCSLRIWADVAYTPARSGTVVQPSPHSLSVHATGLRSITFSAQAEPTLLLPIAKNHSRDTMIHLRLPPPGSALAITTLATNSTISMGGGAWKGDQRRTIQGYRNKTANCSKLAKIVIGIDAAIYYNIIYTPLERSLVAPVSRGWGKALCMPALSPEMEYVIFDWGKFFHYVNSFSASRLPIHLLVSLQTTF